MDMIEKDDISVISPSGLLETHNCDSLKDAISALMKAKKYRIVIDLSKTTFMCSSAWGALIGSIREASRGGGGILLAAMNEDTKADFYKANFNEIIESHETVEKAIAAFKGLKHK